MENSYQLSLPQVFWVKIKTIFLQIERPFLAVLCPWTIETGCPLRAATSTGRCNTYNHRLLFRRWPLEPPNYFNEIIDDYDMT